MNNETDLKVLRDDFISSYNKDYFFAPYSYYYQTAKKLPNVYRFDSVNGSKVLYDIRAAYQLSDDKYAVVENEDKENYLFQFVILFSENLLGYYCDHRFASSSLYGFCILYDHTTDKNELQKLKELVRKHKKTETHAGTINLLSHDDGYFNLAEFKLPDFKIDLTTHYNDDLAETDSYIIERLNKPDDKGILFLYGKPGTGKTYYIRSLIKRVDKKMIFIPPDVAGLIGKPEFMNFLTEESNSIIIIEDAENLVIDSPERKSVVSNILNLSDGLLADCFHIQIICTFNTELHKIDKALLRKGRVIAKYHFNPLEKTKSQKLLDSLNIKAKAEKDMTLAEIYNYNEEDYSEQSSKLGFR